MVLVLGVMGSPRKGGNTDLLLDAALEGAEGSGAVADKVVLADLEVRPCTACGGCDDGAGCVLDDDMAGLYPKLDAADVLILASPVYFDSVTAQMKAFIDRGQVYWVRKYVRKEASKERVGAFLACAARLRTDFTCPERTVRTYLLTLNALPCRTLAYAGFEEKGAITDHPTALEDARALGRELVARLETSRNIK